MRRKILGRFQRSLLEEGCEVGDELLVSESFDGNSDRTPWKVLLQGAFGGQHVFILRRRLKCLENDTVAKDSAN